MTTALVVAGVVVSLTAGVLVGVGLGQVVKAVMADDFTNVWDDDEELQDFT